VGRAQPGAGDADVVPGDAALDPALGLHLPPREHAVADLPDQPRVPGDLLHTDPARDHPARRGHAGPDAVDRRALGVLRGDPGDLDRPVPQVAGLALRLALPRLEPPAHRLEPAVRDVPRLALLEEGGRGHAVRAGL